MITLSKASVAMAVAICIWQEVSSSHSDAANTALAANMLARMVLATAPQLRCTVSLTHSLSLSHTHVFNVSSFAQILCTGMLPNMKSVRNMSLHSAAYHYYTLE